jgi:hypothetical protein
MAWMSKPFLANRKSKTRREWSDDYAKRFKEGEVLQVYDRQPRFKGKSGYEVFEEYTVYVVVDYRKVEKDDGRIEIVEQKHETPREFFNEWKEEGGMYYVIRFEKLPYIF